MKKLMSIFYPKICYLCDCTLQENGLCHQCWGKIVFIQDPACITCGNPFEYDLGKISCAKCIQDNHHIDYAKSIMKYDKNTRKLIMAYKNHGCFYLTSFFSNLLKNTIKEWISDIDYIVPIPLHSWRLFWRGYNQSSILAKNLSKAIKIPYLDNGLLRVRFTGTQSTFNKADRWKNVKGAFEFNYEYEFRFKGKNILLLDDVTTTGATINFAAESLKKAGVNKIYCVTLARSITLK
ncbi:ComF family protein [Candidatus Cytomitobacter primus]|uniref:ComF family protein n=1 Tax=Candidatus Cytomitobacter primus TaxID=2066024 RepID=A0A5C0UG47_9PROT|nr:ComF family protein [Candidatus Cytomitobacter primus]QEK38651.1 ComF family protein [Candidatus Cytomitobacter primus]